MVWWLRDLDLPRAGTLPLTTAHADPAYQGLQAASGKLACAKRRVVSSGKAHLTAIAAVFNCSHS